MTTAPLQLRGTTFHGRKGAVGNRFSYGVDLVLVDARAAAHGPWPFRRNARGLIDLQDKDHGGAPGQGRGAPWVDEVLAAHGLPPAHRLRLLAQPRVLGHVFNPVSFWLCEDAAGGLRVVIAEVSNTWGQRHAYLCHRDDLGVIGPGDDIAAKKVFFVSPFQPVEGGYVFRFDIGEDRLSIRIDYSAGKGEGLVATLAGPLTPASTPGLLGAALRRPFGSRRVLALIHWQAVKLFFKRARWAGPPAPPETEVSR